MWRGKPPTVGCGAVLTGCEHCRGHRSENWEQRKSCKVSWFNVYCFFSVYYYYYYYYYYINR